MTVQQKWKRMGENWNEYFLFSVKELNSLF